MKYKVSVRWTCGGDIDIDAETAQDAFDYVEDLLTAQELKNKIGLFDDVYIYTNSILCDDKDPYITDEDGERYTWDSSGFVYKEGDYDIW